MRADDVAFGRGDSVEEEGSWRIRAEEGEETPLVLGCLRVWDVEVVGRLRLLPWALARRASSALGREKVSAYSVRRRWAVAMSIEDVVESAEVDGFRGVFGLGEAPLRRSGLAERSEQVEVVVGGTPKSAPKSFEVKARESISKSVLM